MAPWPRNLAVVLRLWLALGWLAIPILGFDHGPGLVRQLLVVRSIAGVWFSLYGLAFRQHNALGACPLRGAGTHLYRGLAKAMAPLRTWT